VDDDRVLGGGEEGRGGRGARRRLAGRGIWFVVHNRRLDGRHGRVEADDLVQERLVDELASEESGGKLGRGRAAPRTPA